jgi:hypothetical protein
MDRLASLIVIAGAVAGCGDDSMEVTIDAPPPEVDAPMEMPADATPDAPLATGFTFHDFYLAVDVSPDGRYAVFEDFTDEGTAAVFHDTVTGEIAEVTVLGPPDRVLATGVANNRAMTAFYDGAPAKAGLFVDGAWQTLASPYPQGCDQDVGAAWDVSADGSVAVGMQWNGCHPVAFRWSEADGVVPLTLLGMADGHTPTNRATVISDDGSTVAGFAENGAVDRAAAVWFANGTARLIDDSVDAPSEVMAINADGTTLAGLRGLDGFVWTEAGGFVAVDRLEGYLPNDQVFPNAITADGAQVFGAVGSSFFSIPTAFIWTAAGGTRPLVDLVRAAGIEVPETVRLENVLGVSADGKVLIGTAAVNDIPKTFTLRLP